MTDERRLTTVVQTSAGDARLPVNYEEARRTLEVCASVDECAAWRNGAEALAAYARMAHDDELLNLATRIKARAERRLGELLMVYDGRGGDRSKNGSVSTFAPTRREVAAAAGLTKDAQVRCVRVANVPAAEFEAAVERPRPLTVAQLANLGRSQRSMSSRDTHAAAAHLINEPVRLFARHCRQPHTSDGARHVRPEDVAEMLMVTRDIADWIDEFAEKLPAGPPHAH